MKHSELSLQMLFIKRCSEHLDRYPVRPQSSTVGHWERPSTTTVLYRWSLGAAQYNQDSTVGHLERPNTTRTLLLVTGSGPVQPGLYRWSLGVAQYNHSPLLLVTGRYPVRPQSSTFGHWEIPSTTTVFYHWSLGDTQYNHSPLLLVTGSGQIQPGLYRWSLGVAQYNHSPLPLVTGSGPIQPGLYRWSLGVAQYNHSPLLEELVMMAWLRLWTTGLTVFLGLSLVVSLAEREDSGLPVVEGENHRPRESYPVLSRQKRDWIWNSLYVEEEKPAPSPYKIGQLKSNQKVEAKRFTIDGDGANSIFTVDHKGDLFVTKSLDREEKNMYHLTARMYDGNDKLIEDAGEFVVQVTDINDNTPVFPRTYNGSILERSRIGTKVVEVRATDADDPTTANGELRYSLRPEGDRSAFDIDTITGMITSRSDSLDRETRSQYVLVVQAQDTRGLPAGSTATTSVTITITDINDNMASFTRRVYDLEVREDKKLNEMIGSLELEDRDQIQNKDPVFTITPPFNNMFDVGRSPNKDGNVMLKQALDYETKSSYSFNIHVRENNLQFPADNKDSAVTKAQVNIRVIDVDEPPVFSKPIYNFKVLEETMVNNIGAVTARDPDTANKSIRYSIEDKDCPIGINPITGQLSTLRKLDRELEATHMFQVKAQEEPTGLQSFVKVNILVQDINDNEPELAVDEVFVCENDMIGTVIGTLRATDKDDQLPFFTFSLTKPNANFSLIDNRNNTADIRLKQGAFSLDDPRDYILEVGINDGGRPPKSSITPLAIQVCRCDAKRARTQCKAAAQRMGVSVHALIAILLCILTILVIVILIVMRKRYQKESLVSMKNSGEIHEQLVTYDEEGGGEMDTNGYDVSILTSARHDGSMLRHPDQAPHPSLYAIVQKPPLHPQPSACKGDMAVMIEVKKDEADHDRDGIPYDTLHIYGYEGPESLAGSLSSLGSSSTGSNLDYDFLSDWGPRFRTLAELYGVDGSDRICPY
ncbi:cadherin-5 [Diretmus argenteus]